MAGESGPAPDFVARLEAAPHLFSFFQAVRRLEAAHASLPPVGHSQHPSEDPVRFCQKPSLSFAPSSLSGYVPGSQGQPAKLFVNFMGLLGPNGPMPLVFTEFAYQREKHYNDHTLVKFLDIFHHRMISFFYRAWASNQQTVNCQRGDHDRFADYVGSLFGIGMDALRRRDGIADVAKLHYSGRLACPSKNAEGLRAILMDYLGLPVEIKEFVGRWVDIPPANCCRLGESPETGSLGSTVIAGSRIWECQHRFRIRLGPMTYRQYGRLLPGTETFRRLKAWVRNYVGDEFEWDAQLVLKADEVPRPHLGTDSQLGRNIWSSSGAFTTDAEDLILDPSAA